MRAQRDLTFQYIPARSDVVRTAASFLAVCMGLTHFLYAQSPAMRSEFELVDGDRVVLLGSGFIEAEQEFGYVELALTTRWPERNVIFRNVGWSGDTVRGEARLHYSNPPGPYERLLAEATAPRPTLVFVGYGANVPFEEGDALARFEEGLLRLLEDLVDSTGARIVLLSPPPHEADVSPAPADYVRRVNGALRDVSDLIERVAVERGHLYVDVFGGLVEVERRVDAPITSDGVQLNAAGYFHLARVIEEGLGLAPRGWSAGVNLGSGELDIQGARIVEVDRKDDGVALTLEPDLVSVPRPATIAPEAVPPFYHRSVSISGVPAGGCTVDFEAQEIATASPFDCEKGIPLMHPSLDARAERLRRLIIEKNRLYFFRYRPPNETYLVGFRAYEQGHNAEELDRFTALIEEKEREIERLKRPTPLTLNFAPAAGP